MPYLLEAKHRSNDKNSLLEIYSRFNNTWLLNQGTTYPTIWNGFPKTVGYGMFHKVIFVIDGTDDQIRNLSNLFFDLFTFEIHPLYDVMSEDEVNALPD